MMNSSKLYKGLYELLLAHKLAQAWAGNVLGPLWSDLRIVGTGSGALVGALGRFPRCPSLAAAQSQAATNQQLISTSK